MKRIMVLAVLLAVFLPVLSTQAAVRHWHDTLTVAIKFADLPKGKWEGRGAESLPNPNDAMTGTSPFTYATYSHTFSTSDGIANTTIYPTYSLSEIIALFGSPQAAHQEWSTRWMNFKFNRPGEWNPAFIGESEHGNWWHDGTGRTYGLQFIRGPFEVGVTMSSTSKEIPPAFLAHYARLIDARIIKLIGRTG